MMKKSQMIEQADLEYFHKRLLTRFNALRQQKRSQYTESEEELIELALSRINWGNYRNCLECGEDIGDERLKADPATLTCVKCSPVKRK